MKTSSNAALCRNRFLHGKMAVGCGLDCLDHQVVMSMGISGRHFMFSLSDVENAASNRWTRRGCLFQQSRL
jgi:hypothetical protein